MTDTTKGYPRVRYEIADLVNRLWDSSQMRGTHFETRIYLQQAAQELEALKADRDKWRRIAASLIYGAQIQIDDLRATDSTGGWTPMRWEWIKAQHDFDRATKEAAGD